MFPELVPAALLLALTVVVHSLGMMLLIRWVWRNHAKARAGFWFDAWLLVRIAWALTAIHLLEITIWAVFYFRRGCLPDLESAFYFSGITYTTVGYGDLVLSDEWRLIGPVEGLTGILMCGLSTGFFFAVLSKLYASQRPHTRE